MIPYSYGVVKVRLIRRKPGLDMDPAFQQLDNEERSVHSAIIKSIHHSSMAVFGCIPTLPLSLYDPVGTPIGI